MKKKKKILFVATHRLGRSPSQRFRFEQYLDFLEQNNYEWEISNLISAEDDAVLYAKGNYFKKALIALKSLRKRSKDVKRADEFDIIFIHREALLTRSTKYERLFAQSSAKVVFNFDDAIWLPNISKGNRALKMMKNPAKINDIIKVSDMVFAGNEFLAAYARLYNDNVKVVPTTIDTNYHIRKKENPDRPICIGWTGTQTTLKYLDSLKEVFVELKEKYGDLIKFKVICDQPWEFEGVEVEYEEWNKAREIEQLEEIDIGVMPLVDNEWSKGKCGFKGLQYMAVESAAILSPVGVNTEIIEDGVNGFLAQSHSDWIRVLSLLIENPKLRKEIGKAGRKTIEENYSVNKWKDKYLAYFNELIN